MNPDFNGSDTVHRKTKTPDNNVSERVNFRDSIFSGAFA
jgi:hypothetical protein